MLLRKWSYHLSDNPILLYNENSTFVYNNCTTIKAIASNLILEGQVTIVNNTGSSGGDDYCFVMIP